MAAAIGEAGVVSQVMLSWRYSGAIRDFLARARTFDAFGGRAWFLSDALLGGPFATPWRLERGALLDLGPHAVDLLDAALGPVGAVVARGASVTWSSLVLEHEAGPVSQVALCAASRIDPYRAGVELYSTTGVISVDCAESARVGAFGRARAEFAAAVRTGTPHPLDVWRGLYLQRILAEAEGQLRR